MRGLCWAPHKPRKHAIVSILPALKRLFEVDPSADTQAAARVSSQSSPPHRAVTVPADYWTTAVQGPSAAPAHFLGEPQVLRRYVRRTERPVARVPAGNLGAGDAVLHTADEELVVDLNVRAVARAEDEGWGRRRRDELV